MEATQSNKLTAYAEVIVIFYLDKILDYEIPEDLLPNIQVGSYVQVTLREVNRIGIVTKIKNTTNCSQIVSIKKTLDNICLPKNLMQLIFWISEYYFTPLAKVANSFLPISIQKETKLKQKIFTKKTNEKLKEIIKQLAVSAPSQAIALK